jgi:hypothetical protein
MLYLFHMNVAKIDRDVAYVTMVVHICCKLLLPMFHLFFHMHVASVFIWILYIFSHICCKCSIWMLHIFCNGFKVFLDVFTNVLDACFMCFICLQTYLSNVVSRCFKSRSGVAHVAMGSTYCSHL